MPEPDLPPIQITVEIEEALGLALEHAGQRDALAAELTRMVDDLLAAFGIPGRAVVALRNRGGLDVPLRLRIGHATCQCPGNFFLQIQHMQLGQRSVEEGRELVLAWVKSAVGTDTARPFIVTACRELLQRHLPWLLGEAQAEVWCRAFATDGSAAPSAEELRGWAREALACGLSIAPVNELAVAFANAAREGRDRVEWVEDVLAALQPPDIEIRVAPGYLRVLTETDSSAPEEKVFGLMRDGLFYELGLTFPDFRFVTDTTLPTGCFAFRLNHRVTLPVVGLDANELLVNETIERLRLLDIQALASAINPANRNACSVITTDQGAAAAQAGLTSWTPLGWLILHLSSEVRRHAWGLLSRAEVARRFEQFARQAPDLISAMRERLSVSGLCRVLRELLREEVSIRDLTLIVETILEADYVIADENARIVFDERVALRAPPPPGWERDPVMLADSVRRAFKRYLSHKYTRGQATMIVYLLSPDIERMLIAHATGETPLRDGDVLRLLAAADHELRRPRAGATGSPCVLTTTAARRPFRQILEPVYPWVPVVAYQELSPDMNIQPIERIKLDH